jgi:hypothetical protein
MCELRSGPIRQPVPDQQCTARLRAVMETLSDAHPMDFDQGVRDAFDSVTWFAQAVPGVGRAALRLGWKNQLSENGGTRRAAVSRTR